jgi:hypothetical protein
VKGPAAPVGCGANPTRIHSEALDLDLLEIDYAPLENARKNCAHLTLTLQCSNVVHWVAFLLGSWSVGWKMSDSAPLYGCIILAAGFMVATTILVFLIAKIIAFF